MMNGSWGETTDPGPQGRGIGSPADRLADGRTGIVERAFEVPPLRAINSLPYFARRWHEFHPDLPLVPLRRAEAARKGCDPPPTRTGWVPQDGRWDDPPAGSKLAGILKADPRLGIGLRLGRRGTGMPWVIDIVARNVVESRPALRRMLEDSLRGSARWRDEDGIQRIFVGDDRLAAYGPVIIGAFRDNGGHPEYPALEIRLGSGDPATSLAVLPTTTLANGKPRRDRYCDRFLPLPEGFYEDLARFAGPAGGRADDPQADSTIPTGDTRPDPSTCGAGRTGTAVALRGPDVLPSVVATAVGSAGAEGPGSSATPDLPALATLINRAHREDASAFTEALEHARRAGEWLIDVKARLRHGKFQRWVRDHCEFAYRTAAAYMEVCRRWPDVEGLRSNVQRDAPLSLSGFLKKPARPRSGPGPDEGRTAVEAIEMVEAEALEQSKTGPDVSGPEDVEDRGACHPAPIPSGPDGDDAVRRPARAESTPSPVVGDGGDRGGPGASAIGPSDARPAVPAAGDAPAGVMITEATQRRATDILFLCRRRPIWTTLQRLGNARAFKADATAWRLLRPVAEEFRARHRPDADAHIIPDPSSRPGLLAPQVVALALARPPEEWRLCPGCEGSGRVGPWENPCLVCGGAGYLIEG